MFHDISILAQKSLTSYVVRSKNVRNGIDADNYYEVDTRKMSCTCPWYEHKAHIAVNKPCKHVAFCASVEQNAKVKNRLHYHLVTKGIAVIKIVKFTKARANVYSVVYLVKDGGKCCTFINLNKVSEERYFEAKKSAFRNEPLKYDVFINSNIVTINRMDFGKQFSVSITENGWVRSLTSYYTFEGQASFSLYDACTNPILPNGDHNKLRYLNQLLSLYIHDSDGFDYYEPLTWLVVKNTPYKLWAENLLPSGDRSKFKEICKELQAYIR